MAVCRVEHTKNYSVMANYHLDDRALSLKAKGLLSYMLRQPDDWDYTIEGLTRCSSDGKAAIRSAIEELEDAGYITRQQTHTDTGAFGTNEYIIREIPNKPKADAPPLCDNQTTVPLCGFASAENASAENRTQPSTNIPSTNIPPKAPHRGQRVAKIRPDYKPERFDKFWDFYPCHKSKQAAIRAWDRLQPDDALLAQMARALIAQKQSQAWQRGIGIPYASTWLNNQRWTDGQDPDWPPAEADNSGGWAEDREVI